MVPQLAAFPPIAAAWIFGSVARGDVRPDSDLDLGLLLRTPGESARDHHRMLGDLASRLEGLGDRRALDLVILEPQGPIFCHHAIREGHLIYDADPDRRIDFVSETVIRYLDFAPTWAILGGDGVEGMRAWLDRRRARALR